MDYPNRTMGDDPRIEAAGDFNGDGKMDQVALSEHSQSGEFALVARVSTTGRGTQLIVLYKYDWDDLTRMAVSAARPGTYATACSKGLGSGPCPVKSVTLENDGFYLFVMEASGLLLYWKQGRFHDIWISD